MVGGHLFYQFVPTREFSYPDDDSPFQPRSSWGGSFYMRRDGTKQQVPGKLALPLAEPRLGIIPPSA